MDESKTDGEQEGDAAQHERPVLSEGIEGPGESRKTAPEVRTLAREGVLAGGIVRVVVVDGYDWHFGGLACTDFRTQQGLGVLYVVVERGPGQSLEG